MGFRRWSGTDSQSLTNAKLQPYDKNLIFISIKSNSLVRNPRRFHFKLVLEGGHQQNASVRCDVFGMLCLLFHVRVQ